MMEKLPVQPGIRKGFVFDPQVLWEISKKGIGKDVEEAIDLIIDELSKEYPRWIEKTPKKQRQWIYNNAGGAMGQMLLLHCSLREYILIFGTCVGCGGHSGRYTSEVFDFVFDGEMLCEYEGKFSPEIHLPGSPAYLGSGVIKHYRVLNHSWMLEYARGPIPAMLPFGLFDSIFSTLDFNVVRRTLCTYGRMTCKNFLKMKDIPALIRLLPFLIIISPLVLVIFILGFISWLLGESATYGTLTEFLSGKIPQVALSPNL